MSVVRLVARTGKLNHPHPQPPLDDAWTDDNGRHYDRGDRVRVTPAESQYGVDAGFRGTFIGVRRDRGGEVAVVRTDGKRLLRQVDTARLRPTKQRA